MTKESYLYLAGALVFGIMIGRGQLQAATANTAAGASVVKIDEWWTYAGSWA